jgi:hypothetical protein
MHEIAKGNAIQRVTFLRWWRHGWGTENDSVKDGQLDLNYTDDDTKTTVKMTMTVPDTPEGEALVYSIASANGLQIRADMSNSKEFGWMDWEVGEDTPRLHKWVGYED